jgi:hypothetical protein
VTALSLLHTSKRRFDAVRGVKGGVKPGHCGGAKVGQ